MKIRKIDLKNFRGARNLVSLETKNRESVLIYGNNGTGKSSFLDAIEWFVSGAISHLSTEEIKKNEGLRFNLSQRSEESFVRLEFSNGTKGKKKLSQLKSGFQEKSSNLNTVLDNLKNENLWISNRDLISFILKTKTDKLVEISNLIGYGIVAKTNKVLKKAVGDIKRKIKIRTLRGVLQKKNAL